jgi:hypothetical protein
MQSAGELAVRRYGRARGVHGGLQGARELAQRYLPAMPREHVRVSLDDLRVLGTMRTGHRSARVCGSEWLRGLSVRTCEPPVQLGLAMHARMRRLRPRERDADRSRRGQRRCAGSLRLLGELPVTVETLKAVLDAFNRHDLDAIMAYFAQGFLLEARRSALVIARRTSFRADMS